MFQGKDYVYEVYKERSFSKAARNLFISQPSLSAAIRRVEQKVGYPLFDRSTSPITLTDYGSEYIRAAEEIMAIEGSFANYVSDLGALQTGQLTLGGSNLFSSYVLPPIISRFKNLFPNVTIHLMEESSYNLEQMLLAGIIDLVIDNCPLNEQDFSRDLYQKEHLLLAVPREYEINNTLHSYQVPAAKILDGSFIDSSTAPVPLHVFHRQPFILLKRENDTATRGRLLCRTAGFEPKAALELDQQMTSYNITCSGMGISFISDTLIKHVPVHSHVIYYKLDGAETSRNVYFYRKSGKYVSRVMREFLLLSRLPLQNE